ncbi:Oidioi.mRNA.OKI2018_I69.chr2.g4267.t2.cds [Oikopleura dioica]|uniref:Oidioi.mRNA.OKI2018_I69.chr2.g4267.t2.cds n=1 Tax=Oikopleura dioica TaxID=34765 RepID=A0ABN7SX94_OIKDI|nr:Oidioi.mRNA.OKI2018_I69.chr2.g4267.t2.cds [Oikopleura dioica]
MKITILTTLFSFTMANNWEMICKPAICSKCRSYLIRNSKDRYWVMCSTLSRNKHCCNFRGGPTLFTSISDMCQDKDGDNEIVEKDYEINFDVTDEECQGIANDNMTEITNDLALVSDEFERAMDSKCRGNNKQCSLEATYREIQTDGKYRLDFEVQKDNCSIKYKEMKTCSQVSAQLRTEQIVSALTYIGLIIGGALIGGILIGAMILKRNDHKAMLERSRARTSVQISQSKKKDDSLNGQNGEKKDLIVKREEL